MARFVQPAPLRWPSALFTLAALYGCAGSPGASGASIPATRAANARAAPLELAARVKHVFLADAVVNVVTIFDKDGTTRQLTGFNEPQLLATDSAGNLYVANTEAHNVEVFAPPYRNRPSFTMSDPGEYPESVAVAQDGTVAVIGCHAVGSQCVGGVVYFFANARATSPCARVNGVRALSVLLSGAFDAHGTLYVAGLNDSYETSRLGLISGECNATNLTTLRSTKLHFAAGVAVDKNGNIAAVDSGGPTQGTTLDVFAPPQAGTRKLKLLSQNPLSDSSVVSSFALNKNGTELYTAEPRAALEYDYPQGGEARGELSPPSGGDLIEGVAVTPAEVP